MAPRSSWRGYLRLSLVTCPVAMLPATSEAEKIRFHTLNRATGNRVHAGNTEADTEGCILLGLQATIGSVLKSRKAVESFEAIVRAAKDPVFITIERGGQDAAGFEAVRARLARDAKPPEAIA